MTINAEAVGATSEPVARRWSETDSMLYALAVGAGPDDLAFTTENTTGVALQAYPTQAVVAAPADVAALDLIGPFDRRMILHGSQRVELHRPLAPAGTAHAVTEVEAIHDKGRAAIVALATHAADEDGAPLFTSTSVLFVRGAEVAGGSRGPVRDAVPPPEREPDRCVTVPTRPDQALLYRLTGDRNPLHSDPAAARAVGFERPILHGLCTFGIAGRVLVEHLCDGQAAPVRAIEGRFSAPVLPGDDLTVQVWTLAPGRAAFAVLGADGRPVLTQGTFDWA